MEGETLNGKPPSLETSKSYAQRNPLRVSPPYTTHFLPRSFRAPFTKALRSPPQRYSAFSSTEQFPSTVLPLCETLEESSHPPPSEAKFQESDEDKQQYSWEAEKTGGSPQHGGGYSISGKENGSPEQMHGEENASAAHTYERPKDDQTSVGHTVESPGASLGEGSSQDFVSGASPEVSGEEAIHIGSGASDGESENENTNTHESGCGKIMVHDLRLHEDEKGGVSPLRALSHIAHIKRKQDCIQADVEQWQDAESLDEMHEGSADGAHGAPSERKKFKQVQFQLELLTYHKLIRLLAEQHQGSFQRFVMATLVQDQMEKKTSTITRKAAFSKWKRTRFDQLKGTETRELAQAFRSLAKASPNAEVPSELMHTPWQELNMLQVQKMLEETKKMLLVSEKVHDCPYTDCGRRFSTPGNLKDHLNEHSGEQPYSCSFEDCPHRFRSKQHLCRHMKKHERAHTCTFEGCNKRFAFRERLIVHQKIHSDERPLSCPWEGCGKTFKWANSLHGHMRTHTGEKPFQCTFAGCGRFFGYKVDLTRHRRTHFGQPARATH